MKVSEFNYDLPEELIAQHPPRKRDESRLMVLNPKTAEIEHKHFRDILGYVNQGDCLVLNNTKVIPARLYGIKKDTCAVVEILLLKQLNKNTDTWEALVKPGKKLRAGTEIVFGEGLLEGKIIDVLEDGNRIVEFKYDGIFNEILDKIGTMPLPPYIRERLEEQGRYQTVYAKHEGSSAAPTAGLHFTKELLEEIKARGVKIAYVTLHVGLGTFRPVKVETIEEHDMHTEHFYIKEEDSNIINEARLNGHRVIACGTTSCRVLESVADNNGKVKEIEGDTSIFIYPGYKFKCIDGLITNFHLPQSTLIMLVSAMAGKEYIMKAYEEAVKERYRFFSFGDAMFIQNKV